MKGQSGHTTSQSHLMLLLWGPLPWLSVKLSSAGRACSSWGSCRAASLASPVH